MRQGTRSTEPVRLVAHVAAVLCIGAGVIHVSAAGDHTNLPVMFAGFMVVAALQVGLGALLLLRRPSRPLIAAGLALMVGAIATWLVSRTAGLPFLEDGHTEPVGFKDGVTVLFELASLPLLLLLLSRDLARVTLPSPRLADQAFSFVAVACFALLVPAMLLDGGGHHSHEQAVELGIHGHESSDAAHAGSDRAHAGERASHHRERSSQGSRHDHRRRPGGSDKHEHSDTQLASAPTDGHAHTGGGTPSPHPERDHGDGDTDERHGDGHRERGDGHEDHPRRRGDKPEHEHDDEEPAADEPSQPVDEILADVVSIVRPR